MRSIKILIPVLIFLAFTFMGYNCSSTELTSAKLYINQNNFDKALESLLKEVEKNPKSDEGYYYLGWIYGQKEQYKEMIDAFNKSLAISNTYKQYIDSTKRDHSEKEYNKGARIYHQGTNTENRDSAKIYFENAAEYFQKSVEILPDSNNTYALVLAYMNADDNEKAIEPLEKLVENEKSAFSYRYLGGILYDQGLKKKETDSVAAISYFDKAIKVLEEGKKLYPNDNNILLTLLQSYVSINKIDVAEATIKSGIEAEPNNRDYRFGYGVVLLITNKFEDAEQQFLKAVEIDPNFWNALYNLGLTYVKWGVYLNEQADSSGQMESGYKEKYQKALPYLEKVVELKPDEAAVWELLGKVYYVLGMSDDSQNAYNKADALRPK